MTKEQWAVGAPERKAYYREYYQKRKAIKGLVSCYCFRFGHKGCKGWRLEPGEYPRRKVPCQCYCHVHVCPRCKQPTQAAVKKAIHDAANALELQARQIRRFVEVSA